MPDRHSPSNVLRVLVGDIRIVTVLLQQPDSYPAPTGIPQQEILPMGPGTIGTAPRVIQGSLRSSRSRPRSPRRDVPYIVPVFFFSKWPNTVSSTL